MAAVGDVGEQESLQVWDQAAATAFANTINARVDELEGNTSKMYATNDELESQTSGLQSQVQLLTKTVNEMKEEAANIKGQRDVVHYDSEGDKDEETANEQELKETIEFWKAEYEQEHKGGGKDGKGKGFDGGGAEGKGKDQKKRMMASRRDFPYLPKYGGKHEEFEDWKFKVKTFLREKTEFKQLFLKLEKMLKVPNDNEVLQMTQEIYENSDMNDDGNWLNHQLSDTVLKFRRKRVKYG